jgi:hypothetical protein
MCDEVAMNGWMRLNGCSKFHMEKEPQIMKTYGLFRGWIKKMGVLLLPFILAGTVYGGDAIPGEGTIVDQFLKLPGAEADVWSSAFSQIRNNWQDSFIPMVLEMIYMESEPRFSGPLLRLLEEKTGRSFGQDISKWYDWLWNRQPRLHPQYADFKAGLYGLIDPKFTRYFHSGHKTKIRLDEVAWGGVRQDGIPPLRQPKMIDVAKADYLTDGNFIFGIEVNGDVRAYPKRVLAWHEMFVDEVGGIPVAGVYCTLCGTMVLFKTIHRGINYSLGTSGFLYRSNKLMYDKKTSSLWNTLWGKPVIGPLAEKDIQLERMSVVTTTWGEWRRRHPETKVLSLETGYYRDYSEGAAYREYFATDQLMFPVPKLDLRLKNKDEILGLLLSPYQDKPLAVSVKYLYEHPLYHHQIEDVRFVALTDRTGAIRVYEAKNVRFVKWDRDQSVTDEKGGSWKLTESRLESKDGCFLRRLPAHRAFWFGWYAAYPQTQLIR